MGLQRFDNAELACEFAKRQFAKTGTPRCVHAAVAQNGAKYWYVGTVAQIKRRFATTGEMRRLVSAALVRNRHLDKEEIYRFLRNYTGKGNRFQVAANEFNIGLSTAYKIYYEYRKTSFNK